MESSELIKKRRQGFFMAGLEKEKRTKESGGRPFYALEFLLNQPYNSNVFSPISNIKQHTAVNVHYSQNCCMNYPNARMQQLISCSLNDLCTLQSATSPGVITSDGNSRVSVKYTSWKQQK